jgi:hopanoid biosynthesis associated protein HpnK
MNMARPTSQKADGRLIVVHADDLGISEPVNSGIALAHRQGILTSASLMAVGDAFEHALEICRSLPTLDVGVHLTLVEERPILPSETLPSLTGPSGNFLPTAMDFTGRYLAQRIDLGEVYRELDAQVKRVVRAGVPISHLASHQHLHMLPGIFKITKQLAHAYGISAIRVPRERVRLSLLRHAASPIRIVQQLVLNGFCLWNMRQLDELRHADHFAGFLFGGNMQIENFRRTIENLPAQGSIELMCHPSLPQKDERYLHWGYNGEAELEALLHPDAPRLLESLDLRLGTYRDIQ